MSSDGFATQPVDRLRAPEDNRLLNSNGVRDVDGKARRLRSHKEFITISSNTLNISLFVFGSWTALWGGPDLEWLLLYYDE